jgi:dipeptidase E
MRRLLLVSSSRTFGTGYLDHCLDAFVQHAAGAKRVLFIPYALADRDGYAAMVRATLAPRGLEVESLHEAPDPVAAARNAQAIFAGGGNTFRLLKTLYDLNLVDALRRSALAGVPWIGTSAGTNIACPTIRTTNDMPIVEPPSLAALHLVPFQINPHYLDAKPDDPHQGETRAQRLAEYLEENDRPVLAIREGCWLHIEGDRGVVGGTNGGLIFRRGQPPQPLAAGDRLDSWLAD